MSLLGWLENVAKAGVQDAQRGAQEVAHVATLGHVAGPSAPQAPAPQAQAAPPQQQPTFYFRGTGQPGVNGHENWQFLNGHPPVKFDVNLPQNTEGDWSLYGDRTGKMWYENNKTGDKMPYAAPKAPVDSPLPPTMGPSNPFNKQMDLPIQHLIPSMRQPVGIQA